MCIIQVCDYVIKSELPVFYYLNRLRVKDPNTDAVYMYRYIYSYVPI